LKRKHRKTLERRWRQLGNELFDLYAGKVVRFTDPATREAELLAQQAAIEAELYDEPDDQPGQEDDSN